MTMLNAPFAKVPESSPWHTISGIVVTITGALAVMLMVNFFVR
jgi:hypothetical protein